MTAPPLRLQSPDPASFTPYGRLVTPPDEPGKRQFYSDALPRPDAGAAGATSAASAAGAASATGAASAAGATSATSAAGAPVLHVNSVVPQDLPLRITRVERHPHAAQCFFPLDVSRYAVVVMPSDGDGLPCPARALGFLMPGTMGVIFHPGVWHLGATVLDRVGHFTVLMWRGGPLPDDDFHTIAPLTVIAPP